MDWSVLLLMFIKASSPISNTLANKKSIGFAKIFPIISNFQLKVTQENKAQKSLGSLSVAAEVMHVIKH